MVSIDQISLKINLAFLLKVWFETRTQVAQLLTGMENS
jgi:hypothetical protein